MQQSVVEYITPKSVGNGRHPIKAKIAQVELSDMPLSIIQQMIKGMENTNIVNMAYIVYQTDKYIVFQKSIK